MERETDGALIRRTCAGDGDAFEVFVDRYKNSLVNYLTHLTRSRDRAEELAQDAFVRFYRNAAKCRNEERLGGYLFRIGTNLATSQARRELSWLRILPRFVATQPRSAPAADRPLLTDEVQRKVTAALERLPVKFRAPLVLYEIEEWSYEEISQALGCRIGTVKSRIWRARTLMREQLESWWIGGCDDERHGRWQRHAATAANEGIASLHG
jgi:RNA polymerase sigma-70 factor (ECF subfamily)